MTAALMPLPDVHARPLAHLPLVVALLDKLGVTKVLEDVLPKDPRSNVSDADCVNMMVINILSGRVSLYRMEQWTQNLPVDVLVGPHASPEDFTDARLAKTLDHLFEAGTDTILSSVARTYLASQEHAHSHILHQDTTSILLYGAYDGPWDEGSPIPRYGYSKDHRPDLKQLVFGLTLHGAAGVPIVATMFDGNTSDKAFNAFHMDSLSKLLPKEDEITLVADSKLVDKELLGKLIEQGMHFISLVPRTFSVRENALKLLALEQGELPELGRTPGRNREKPDSVYRGRSYDFNFSVRRPESKEEEVVKLRFLAVHSEALARKFEASLPDKLEKEKESVEKAFASANKRPYTCQTDAENALSKISKGHDLHAITAKVEAFEIPAKRPKGRPRKEDSGPATETRYRLVLESCTTDETGVANARRSKSHLVLVTDHLDRAKYTDAELLTEYRKQYLVEGHTGFRWLKGPGQVAPAFLKTPKRISGLGLVLILALMVRNYLQFTIRNELATREEVLPYYDRKKMTSHPTAEVIWSLFTELVLLELQFPGSEPILRLQGFGETQKRVLTLLGLDPEALTRRKKSGLPSERP